MRLISFMIGIAVLIFLSSPVYTQRTHADHIEVTAVGFNGQPITYMLFYSHDGEPDSVKMKDGNSNSTRSCNIVHRRSTKYTTTDVLDSTICFEYNSTINHWEHSRRVLWKYDQNAQRINETESIWDNITQSWHPFASTSYSYFQNGLLFSQTIQVWNALLGTWENAVRLESLYNENDKYSHGNVFTWHEGDWSLSRSDTAQYDEDGILQEVVSFNPNGNPIFRYVFGFEDGKIIEQTYQYYTPASGGQWIPISQSLRAYNELGLQIETVIRRWLTGTIWENVFRDSMFYDDEQLVARSSWWWDESKNYWVNDSYNEYTYDGNRLSHETINHSWLPIDYQWQGYSRREYKYNESDSIVENTHLLWDYDAGDWGNYNRIETQYDASGRLIYQGDHYWNDERLRWNLAYEFHRTYDDRGNLLSEEYIDMSYGLYGFRYRREYTETNKLSSLLFQGLSPDSTWINEDQTLFAYDHKDSLILELNQRWDNEEWRNVNQTVTEYVDNPDGSKAISTRQYWDSVWIDLQRTTLVYNLNMLQTSFLAENWDDQWVPSQMSEFTYNEDNLLEESISSFWRRVDSIWLQQYRTIYDYDLAGRIILTQRYEWHFTDMDWWLTRHTETEYDDIGQIVWESILVYFQANSGSGSASRYEFDENGNQVVKTQYKWSNLKDDWQPESRSEQEFNENGDIVEARHATWNSLAMDWEYIERAVTVFDSTGFPGIHIVEESLNGGSWIPKFRVDRNKDDSENIANETFSRYEVLKYGWVMASRCEDFWSKLSTSTNTTSTLEEVKCIYPNPFNAKSDKIICQSPRPGLELRLSVLDMQGRLIDSYVVLPGQTTGLARALSSGTYVLILDDQGKIVFSDKLVVISN